MNRDVVYTLHLWPPLGHAAHYTGTTPDRRLERRLTDHALGRGARLTQVQIERGGSWVLAQTQPGGRPLERRLKQHGATRRCEVCKAVSAFQAGELPAADALAQAGWDRSNPAQRSILLDIFGLPEPPEPSPPVAPSSAQDLGAWHSCVPAPRSSGEPEPWAWPGQPAPADPALAAAVEALEQSWLTPQPDAHRLPEPVMEAGL